MDYPQQEEIQQNLVTNSDANSQNNLLNQQQPNQQLNYPNTVQTDKPGFVPTDNVQQPQLNMAPAPQQPIMVQQQPIMVQQQPIMVQQQPIIGQPVAYVQPVVASNQVNPNPVIVRNPQDFKCTPIVCTCPNCKNTVTTIVTTNFNVANCCCCFLTNILFWILFQCLRDKDISCNDATHICPHCQYVIFNYSAC